MPSLPLPGTYVHLPGQPSMISEAVAWGSGMSGNRVLILPGVVWDVERANVRHALVVWGLALLGSVLAVLGMGERRFGR